MILFKHAPLLESVRQTFGEKGHINHDRIPPRNDSQRAAILLDNHGTGDYPEIVFGAHFTDLSLITAICFCIPVLQR